MHKDWLTLAGKYTVPGARDKFESICSTLFKKIYPTKNVRSVKVKIGDGGIDIFIGFIGVEPIHVIQCKYFPKGIEDSQKQQIRESFKTALDSDKYEMYKWSLCIINELDIDQHKWWCNWKAKKENANNLPQNFIELIDGNDLIDLLKEYELYDIAFDRKDSIRINKLYEKAVNNVSLEDLKKRFLKTSTFLVNVKNYFGEITKSHVERNETKQIIDWIDSDLKHPLKNVLILQGEKGMGKSVILKDTYTYLQEEGCLILGIKADKYYASTPKDLEYKLFLESNISFTEIIKIVQSDNKKLVVIIDQLDALSQSLSSKREYIQTYNRIINELVDEKNIRIIISCRTFDLNYDAELSAYKSNKYKKITANTLSEKDVVETLNKFDIKGVSKKIIDLFKTPNHLEVFCKLPDKSKINLNSLSSLKDLYDKLWETLILSQLSLQLKKVLYTIAVEMYKRQKIVIDRSLVTDFQPELNYLFSNQLLTIEDSKIQFFHQTFYDYCFSRQFVEEQNDIYKYLNKNEQNLEIRSIVKMVFEYLREFDHEKYIKYSRSILRKSKYRFHLKSLIVINLGLVSPSNEEKHLFEKLVLKRKRLLDVFINSACSKGWIEYIIENKIPEKYLFNKKNKLNYLHDLYKKQSFFQHGYLESLNFDKILDYKKNAIWVLFRNNINIAPHLIITYLDELPDFENKNYFIERVLCNLDNWGDSRMLPYFHKYIPFEEGAERRDNFWFYQILQKILEHNLNYVFSVFKPILINRFNDKKSWYSIEFLHDHEELLKKLYNVEPEKTFEFLLSIYIEVIEGNKRTKYYKEIDSPYYDCTKFYDGISASKEGHIFIQEFLLKHLLDKKHESDYILSFYNRHKDSNSIHLLRLLVLLFKEIKNDFKNEVFELVNIIYSKNGLNGSDDRFQLYLRQLIGSTFTLFSDKEKERITDILLSIKYPYDLEFRKYKDSEGKDRVHFTGYGRKQYLFLCLLPPEEINLNVRLKKVFQELNRKYGIVDANKARDVSSGGSYIVGAPLEQKAYVNMNLKSWKKSILKFNDDYVEGHGPKGGALEHSRAFTDVVKENPEKFYQFIFDLFDDNRVSIMYLSAGINGLIEGGYTPERVKILCKKLIKLNLDRSNTLYAIWKIEYLIKNGLVDQDLMKFLCDKALNHSSPQKPLNLEDPLLDSLNTVRGAAIHKIIKCYEHQEFSEIIFETIEKATNDPQISVKVAIIQNIAFLNHLDIKRSFKIFMKLTEEDDIHLLRNSIRASQYFNNKFHYEMLPYFNKIIANEDMHKNGQVIILSWLNEKINDKKLFERFVKLSKEAKICAIDIAEANLIEVNNNINDKCLEILTRFLNEKGEDFAQEYSSLILRKIKPPVFKKLYSFLFKYSKTTLCRLEPTYFLQLLIKCARDYPVECLNLVQNMNFSEAPNVQERGYYREEPVQLILAIYSKLNMNLEKNKKDVKKSLDIFDSMLTHSHLRNSASRAIELTL